MRIDSQNKRLPDNGVDQHKTFCLYGMEMTLAITQGERQYDKVGYLPTIT